MAFLVCSYTLLVIFAVTTALAMYNFFKFVIQRGGNRRVTHPLLGFYVLIILTLVGDIIYSLLIVRVSSEFAPFVIMIPPTFKCLSGIEQFWMLVELSLHLRLEIMAHTKGLVYQEHEMLTRLNRLIEKGRIFVFVTCLLFFTGMLCACI